MDFLTYNGILAAIPDVWKKQFFIQNLLITVRNTTYEISLAAAEDVLAGSIIPTTIVIIAIAVPVLGVKTTAPWFLQKCPYLHKSCVVVFLLVTGLIVIVAVQNVHWRLFGISVIESGVSFSEITFLALTASYQEVTVSAFVAGIGVASLLGPLYYTG